jgi:hypothetical protein
MGAYPKAECREVPSSSGSYYLIYDMGAVVPDMLGYDIDTESKAWDMVANRIGKLMVEALEQQAKNNKS